MRDMDWIKDPGPRKPVKSGCGKCTGECRWPTCPTLFKTQTYMCQRCGTPNHTIADDNCTKCGAKRYLYAVRPHKVPLMPPTVTILTAGAWPSRMISFEIEFGTGGSKVRRATTWREFIRILTRTPQQTQIKVAR